MNQLMIKRLQIALVILFVTLGLAALTGAVKIFQAPDDIQETANHQVDLRLFEHCVSTGNELGFRKRPGRDRSLLVFSKPGLDNPFSTTYLATVLARECAGYEVAEFCIGKDCGEDLQMTLKKRGS